MTELAKAAPTLWKMPSAHRLAAQEFDRRQLRLRGRAGRALDSLEADITSLSKAAAFRLSVSQLERNRYIEPHKLATIRVYKAKKRSLKQVGLAVLAAKKPEWSLDSSIWAPRKKWCDSLNLYDTDDCERKKFDWIWQTCREEQGIDKLILRNDDDGGADEDGDGTPDEVAEVGDVLWDFHDLLFCLFDYYCGVGANLLAMAFNQWSELLEDCQLVNKKSKFCKKADMDRLFIAVDTRQGKPSKALSRVEFLAALVHLCINKYVLTGEVKDVSEAMFKLLQEDVEGHMEPRLFEEANVFRSQICYRQDVSEVLAKHEVSLRRLFKGVGEADGRTVASKHMASLVSFAEWKLFVRQCKLVGPDLTERDAKLAFVWSRMAIINGASNRGAEKEANLPFEGFLEALCRLAVLKSLPIDAELEAAGTLDAGLYVRHLYVTDEAAYDELIATRSSPWPGNFNMGQPPGRCVEHLIMMIFRTVQGVADDENGPGPCGAGSSVDSSELAQADVKKFCRVFLDVLGTGH